MITEFFRFFLCITFLLFCVVYYKEYEQKLDLERKEQIINISFEQQKKEMELMKESLRLWKELEEAKKENLFLKKAAAFFAKEID